MYINDAIRPGGDNQPGIMRIVSESGNRDEQDKARQPEDVSVAKKSHNVTFLLRGIMFDSYESFGDKQVTTDCSLIDHSL